MADLPPSYEDIVGVPSAPPLLPGYGDIPSQSEKLSSLVDEACLGMSTLAANQPSIDDMERTVVQKQQELDKDLDAWYSFIKNLIDKQYHEKKAQIKSRTAFERKHLHTLNEKCQRTINRSTRLYEQAMNIVRTGNPRDVNAIKEKIEDHMKEMADCNNAFHTDADRWFFQKANLTQYASDGLMGRLYLGRPSQPVLVSDSPPVVASRDAASNRVAPNVGEASSAFWNASGADSAAHQAGEEDKTPKGENSPPEVDLKYNFLYSFPAKTYKDKARCHPMCITYSIEGSIIVPDKLNQKVKIFTTRGQLIQEITHPMMISPVSVALNLHGDLLVGDTEARDIKLFSINGTLLQFYKLDIAPSTIAVNSRGNIIIGDITKRQVHVLDTLTNETKMLISKYYAPVTDLTNTYRGMMPTVRQRAFDYCIYPHYVTVAPGDHIYVCDRSGKHIQCFKSDGTFVKRYGSPGSLLGQFKEPYGLAVDPRGAILIADYDNHRIQKMRLSGEFLDPVLEAEQHDLKFPTFVALTPDRKLIVTEYLSGLVKVFGTEAHVNEEAQTTEMPPAYGTTYTPPSAPPVCPGYESTVARDTIDSNIAEAQPSLSLDSFPYETVL